MYHGNNDYISIVDNTDEQYHRKHIILHRGGTMFYTAEFDTVQQLDFFAQTLGFTYTAAEWKESERFGIYREYTIDRKINNAFTGGFWKLEDLPSDAKPIKALSNGSIVTCYYTNDGETITIYRPNPNAKAIYSPLPLSEHLAQVKTYGLY